MIFICCIFIFILLSSYLNDKFKYSDVIWLTISALLLCVFAGLRDVSYGSDLSQYFVAYDGYVPFFSYTSIWGEYVEGVTKDGLFYLTMKLFHDIGISYQWFMALVSGFYITSVGWFTHKYSKNQTISLLMFMVLEWYIFSFTALRQTVAMGFCVFALVRLMDNPKDLVAILLIGVAGLFHSSAWIFFLAVVVARFNFQVTPLRFVMLVFSSLVFALAGQSFFRKLVVIMAWNSSLANYATSNITLNWTGFFIQLAFACASYWTYRKTVEKYPQSALLYTLMAIGIGFQTFSSVIAEMFRVSMYFSISSICVYPLAINSFENKRIRFFCQYGSYLLLFAYLLVSAKFAGYIPIFH